MYADVYEARRGKVSRTNLKATLPEASLGNLGHAKVT